MKKDRFLLISGQETANIFYTFKIKGGDDENFQVYAVSPTEKPEEGKEVPVSRNLTNKERTRVYIYSVPKAIRIYCMLDSNDRDASWHDLYELKISTGDLKLLRTNTDRITGWFFDRRDKLRLIERTNRMVQLIY